MMVKVKATALVRCIYLKSLTELKQCMTAADELDASRERRAYFQKNLQVIAC